jgi:hypothetical protein
MYDRSKRLAIRLLGTAALAMLMLAEPASAQSKDNQPQGNDPNAQIICEKITVTGSRLSTKRICGTRAEWAERRLRDRQEVERAQLSPCVVTHSTGTGRPACH